MGIYQVHEQAGIMQEVQHCDDTAYGCCGSCIPCDEYGESIKIRRNNKRTDRKQ